MPSYGCAPSVPNQLATSPAIRFARLRHGLGTSPLRLLDRFSVAPAYMDTGACRSCTPLARESSPSSGW